MKESFPYYNLRIIYLFLAHYGAIIFHPSHHCFNLDDVVGFDGKIVLHERLCPFLDLDFLGGRPLSVVLELCCYALLHKPLRIAPVGPRQAA